MTREEILEGWRVDADIDPTHLGDAALDVPRLHSKWIRILAEERLVLRRQETDYKKLALMKYEFLLHGPTTETVAKGWELPPRGRLIKNEVDRYLDVDEELSAMQLRMSNQREKVAILEEIMRSINSRNWTIRNVLENRRIENGG